MVESRWLAIDNGSRGPSRALVSLSFEHLDHWDSEVKSDFIGMVD